MNSSELVEITPEWNTPIAKGTLIGFAGLGGTKITAAYPVYKVNLERKDVDFVLYTSLEGRPCLDGTSFAHPRNNPGDSKLFINKEPIIIEIEEQKPFSVTDRIAQLFNGGEIE